MLVGGKAGQYIDTVAHLTALALTKMGYYTFYYRDYQSLIRGGHNFNIVSISDKKIGSILAFWKWHKSIRFKRTFDKIN